MAMPGASICQDPTNVYVTKDILETDQIVEMWMSAKKIQTCVKMAFVSIRWVRSRVNVKWDTCTQRRVGHRHAWTSTNVP